MVDSLLRLQYVATDAVAATSAARSVLGSAEVSATAGPFSWRQASLVDDGITISRIEIAGERVRLRLERSAELLVVLVHEGAVELAQGEHRVELRPDGLGLVPIDAAARLLTSTASIEVFSFPPAPIARLLGVPKHAVRLRTPRVEPQSEALAAYLRAAASLFTTRVFGMPEVYGRDLVRTHAIDHLAAVIVEAFDITNRSEDDTDRDITVLRRAIAELRAHLQDPISIPEVAAAAGVSVRGLQLVFQRQLGMSPLLHLRQLRLESARQTLLDEADAGVTVADVARRYGYANSGRFSTHYRDAYDESPAASLHRIRSRPPGRDRHRGEADLVQHEG